ERRLPRGSLLPAESDRSLRPAAARASRRNSEADRLLHREVLAALQPARAAALRRTARALSLIRVAGQRARARKHDQAVRDPAGRAAGRPRAQQAAPDPESAADRAGAAR